MQLGTGKTEWNVSGRQQGHLDSPLTANGIEQAKLLAGAMVGKWIKYIYSSDLGRALETANIIAEKLGLKVNTDVRLRERHLGIMHPLTKKDFFCQISGRSKTAQIG